MLTKCCFEQINDFFAIYALFVLKNHISLRVKMIISNLL